MKSASSALIAPLLTKSFVLADLYTITLVGGGIIRVTTLDRDVVASGLTWTSGGPYLDGDGNSRAQKATTHQKIGLDVDTLTFAVQPRSIDPFTGAAYPDRIGAQPWLSATTAGALDGAEVQIDRAYWAAWPAAPTPIGAPVGVLSALFAGRIAGIVIDRGMATITVNSHLELLTQQIPRNFYGAACRHTLFDAGCGLSPAAFATSGTLTSVTSNNIVSAANITPPGSGTFALGRILFNSGANAGVARLVRAYSAGTFTLIAPLPFQPQSGDAFVAYPGCDRAQATCTRFANLANFGGQPYIPQAETSV